MSEHTESTTTTTTRRQRQRDEARDLLKTLRTENPEADRSALTKLYINHFWSLIPDDADRDAIAAAVITPLREWLGAEIRETEPKAAKKTREERAAAKAESAAYVAAIATNDHKRIDEIVTRRLLEWEIIDGRRLGDLTGADCRNLSERCGVFLHVISDNIPARAKVRNHYTELELQALARHHKLIVP